MLASQGRRKMNGAREYALMAGVVVLDRENWLDSWCLSLPAACSEGLAARAVNGGEVEKSERWASRDEG